MGDRGNIVVIHKVYGAEDYEGVWLYSHWGGSRLEQTARKAVANSGRVGDPDYLTRIIFCNMIADGFRDLDTGQMGDEIIKRETDRFAEDTTTEKLADFAQFLSAVVGEFMNKTGAGIGTQGAGDQEHPTVCVDADTGEIWLDDSRPYLTSQVVANRQAVGV
jgi:hypothetical protein